MVPSGVAALGTAAAGREVRTAEGPWGWLGKVAGPALDAGPYGQIDDFHALPKTT
jgi:hypothetical protein